MNVLAKTKVALPQTGKPRSKRYLHAWIRLVLVLVAAFIGLLAWLWMQLDARHLEQLLNQHVLAEKQRTLTLNGPVQLRLWPRLEVELNSVSLSEHHSPRVFAQLEKLHLALQWWPLLERRWAVDELAVQGLSVALERDAAGRLNVDDLLTSGKPASWTYAVARLQLAQGRFIWRDQPSGRVLTLDGLTLNAGPYSNAAVGVRGRLELTAQRVHSSAAQINAHGGLVADYLFAPAASATPDAPRAIFQHVEVHLAGELGEQPDTTLTLNIARLQWFEQQRTAEGLQFSVKMPAQRLLLELPRLSMDATGLRAPRVALDYSGTPRQDMHLQAQLSTPLFVDGVGKQLLLDRCVGHLDLSLPRQLPKPVHMSWDGLLTLDIQQMQGHAELAGAVDQTQYAVQLSARQSVDRSRPLPMSFKLDLGRLNLDDYRLLADSSRPQTTVASRPASPAWQLPQGTDLQGEVRVAQLQMAKMQLRNLHLLATTRDGHLRLKGVQ